VAQAGKFGIICHNAVPDEILEADRKCHKTRNARDTIKGWLGIVQFSNACNGSLFGLTAASLGSELKVDANWLAHDATNTCSKRFAMAVILIHRSETGGRFR
jgi:hypothetical protein